MTNDPRADLYFKLYTAQKGGELPVYRGSRYIQYGSGFGDILRSIFRHVFPVVAEGASAFFGNLVQNRNSGSNWQSAAKAAIAPTAKAMVESTGKQIAQNGNGQPVMIGSGKRKRKHGKKHKRKHSKKKKRTSVKNFVYKGKKPKAKKKKLTFSESTSKIPSFNF